MSKRKNKEYTQKEHRKAWTTKNKDKGSNFMNTCVECGGPVSSNDDYNYGSEWWASYTCDDCGIRFRYMPSDMGQTLPQLEQYSTKEEQEALDKQFMVDYEEEQEKIRKRINGGKCNE